MGMKIAMKGRFGSHILSMSAVIADNIVEKLVAEDAKTRIASALTNALKLKERSEFDPTKLQEGVKALKLPTGFSDVEITVDGAWTPTTTSAVSAERQKLHDSMKALGVDESVLKATFPECYAPAAQAEAPVNEITD